MPLPAIRLDVHQPLDVHGGVLAEIAFHIALLFDDLANAIDLVLAQILNLLERIHMRDAQYLQSPRIAGKIDACNTCHTVSFVLLRKLSRSGYSGRIPYRSVESLETTSGFIASLTFG